MLPTGNANCTMRSKLGFEGVGRETREAPEVKAADSKGQANENATWRRAVHLALNSQLIRQVPLLPSHKIDAPYDFARAPTNTGPRLTHWLEDGQRFLKVAASQFPGR